MQQPPSFPVTAGRPMVMGSTPPRALRVVRGGIELFLILQAERHTGRRHHIASVPEGSWIFDAGFSAQDGYTVIAVGQADTELVEATNADSRAWIEWLDRLGPSAARQEISLPGDSPVPDLSAMAGENALRIKWIAERTHASSGKEVVARDTRLRLRESAVEEAWSGIASVLVGDSGVGSTGAVPASAASLVFAFEAVAQHRGIVARRPENLDGLSTIPGEAIAALSRASSVRMRRVFLQGEWYRTDNGPLVGLIDDGKEAVALIPRSRGGYFGKRRDGSSFEVGRKTENSPSLDGDAYFIYRSLPDRRLALRDIVSFSIRGQGRDIVMLAFMVVLTGLLGMASPFLTARIFDVIIPQAEQSIMLQIGVILVTLAFVRSLFELTRGFAMLRIQNRTDASLQAAVWDRLLKLPTGFFRNYTSGDLANRAQGITQIHDTLSSVGTSVLLALPTGLFNFFVMFQQNVKLAFWGLGLALLALVVSVGLNARQVFILRKQFEVSGRLAGLVYQIISGVSKFRIAGAEHLAFAAWAKEYARQERFSMESGRWGVAARTFFGGFTLFTSVVIFAVAGAGLSGESSLTTGSFLAFNAAFGALVAALIMIGNQSLGLLQIFPLLERTKPIFEAEPEVNEERASPGVLGGMVEMANIRFRYAPDVPPVLDDFSMRIQPGEFVALVGPSGSGKSTILRLLLGFEKPESGTVFYDGKDLQSLDLREVRRQVGVVMQNSQLIPGDIFRNIVGETSLTLEDAWRAADMAGLADDIRAMPMQMHTVVSEGGAGFSGGQRQRLAIARALVRNPRIIFLDEATSALDNRTQAMVTASLESLRATRLVIAHRLSTVMQADRIVVLRNGVVAEEGKYEDLMQSRGYFYELASRQLAAASE